ncbi:hypothetical protein [Geodermatophilus sp. SYSU D00815]
MTNVDDLPGSRSQRWRSHSFMNAVALLLRDWGLHDARPARKDEAGDLAGVPGFTMTARNVANIELSTSLDAVVAEAKAAPGDPMAAAIIARRGREVSDAYAVLRLSDLADLMAQAIGTDGAPLSARVRPRPVEP